MRTKDKCTRCSKRFFIEHENVSVVDDNDMLLSVMDTNVPVGYKIMECVFCSKMHIGRQYDKGKMEELIPVEEFNSGDMMKFKERVVIRGGVDISDETLHKMMKSIG